MVKVARPAGRRASRMLLSVLVCALWLQLAPNTTLAREGLRSTADPTVFAAYQDALLNQLIPAVQNLPGYVDGYFDHDDDSRLILQFERGLEPDNELIASLSPAVDPAPAIESVDYSAGDVRDAILRAWESVPNSLAVQAVSFDTESRSVVLEVLPGQREPAAAEAPELARALGMPVDVIEAAESEDAACTTRENCYSPMKSGTVIRRGSTTGSRCTMGFHVQVGTDEQFVTAGHCGYVGSNAWYHAGYPGADCSGSTGCVGFETATQYGPNGRDIMRVQMNDAQDSNVMWAPGGSSSPVGSAVDPMQGMWTCMTRGVSESYWTCGWLTHTSTSWTSDTCGCIVFGAKSGIGATGGDSGSPIVVGVAGSWRALGILNQTDGKFARVEDALAAWGITIRL